MVSGQCFDHHLHPLAAIPFVDAQPVGQPRRAPAAARRGRTRSRRVPGRRGAGAASGACRRPAAAAAPAPRRRTAAPRNPGPRPARPAAATVSALNHSSASGPSVRSVRVSVAASSHSPATVRSALSNRATPASGSVASSVQPAAIAWPPKRSSRPGWRLATRSSASRRWKPGIDRPEPLQLAVGAAREDEGRPVQAVLQAPGDDADDAFVEALVEQRQRRRRGVLRSTDGTLPPSGSSAAAPARPARACRPRRRAARG